VSHLVFCRIPSTNYMCVEDIHTTHIVTNMEIIKDNVLLHIKASVSAPYSISITKGFMKAQRLALFTTVNILVGHILLNLSHYFSE